jgi:TonB family protein
VETDKKTKIQLSYFWSPLNRNLIVGIRYSPIYRPAGLGSGSLLKEEVGAVSVVPTVEETNSQAITEGVRLISKPRPAYTEEAKRNNVTGIIKVMVTFQADGQIGDVSIVEGLPYGLDEQAIEAARRIKFEPAKRNGVPYTTTKVIEYSMTLY